MFRKSVKINQSMQENWVIQTVKQLFPKNLEMEIRNLISVPENIYQQTYFDVMKNFVLFAQNFPAIQKPYDQEYGLLNLAFDRTIVALKYRRSYSLPQNVDYESQQKEKDAWTFGLFSASFLKDSWQIPAYFQIAMKDRSAIGDKYWNPFLNRHLSEKQSVSIQKLDQPREHLKETANLLLVKQLISNLSFEWIYQHQELFRIWSQTLVNSNDEDNVFIEILKRAESVLLDQNDQTLGLSYSSKIVTEQNTNDFLIWLGNILLDQCDEINTQGFYIHRVEAGLLLVFPDALKKFKGEQYDISNQQHIDRFIKLFVDENFIINVKDNSFLHNYYFGDYHDRQILSGLLLPLEKFFKENNYPTLNKNLHIDPMID